LIGIYLGRSAFNSAYGAAGSLVVLLLWIYYSAQILFFGAQLTCICVSRFGVKPHPVSGAEFVPIEIKHPSKAAPK